MQFVQCSALGFYPLIPLVPDFASHVILSIRTITFNFALGQMLSIIGLITPDGTVIVAHPDKVKF